MTDGSHDPTAFAFNPHANVDVVRIGRTGIAVSVIDHALCDPEGVAALGLAQSYTEDRDNFYPGVRAAVPDRFSTSLRAWLTPLLQRNGMLASNQVITRDASFFSAVTTASEDLRPIQRIPHYDSTDPTLFAAVIYLCGPKFGGTAFYRHRRTGYEQITEHDESNYQLALNHDLRVHGAPKHGYIASDSPLFETTFAADLKFNRAIVYPARVLHAAKIDRRFRPSQDRGEWRLTVTTLLYSAAIR